MSSGVCAACRRSIDASARTCPYCGSDPATGERVDTQALMEEVFRPKSMTRSESVIEYARQRQGVVIGVSIGTLFLILALLHSFVTARNDTAVSDAPALPLTEIADVAKQSATSTQTPLPQLDFQYDGRPQAMHTMIAEPGAVPPQATTTAPSPKPAPQ